MNQLAVIQMTSVPDVAANLSMATRLLQQAALQGARLAVLPENFATFGCGSQRELALAEVGGNGPLLRWLQHTARELGLWIVAGTLPLLPQGQREGLPCAASLLVDDQGRQVARYDKLHLFAAELDDRRGHYREADDFSGGRQICVADSPFGRIGLSVCYDLRFPELYRAMRERGAELICVPAAFAAVTGAAHWEVLVRARAIETQCCLLASNQGGLHPGGRETHGQSMIVDAWGRMLDSAAHGEAVLLAAFDQPAQQRIRQRMPLIEHRRFAAAALQPLSEE